MQWKKNNSLLTGLLLLVMPTTAQSFLHTAVIDTVRQPGFYRINISPGLSGFLKVDFSDLRIADKNERWVPHIIEKAKVAIKKDFFHEFPILKNQLADSGKTEIILKNTSPSKVFGIKLFCKNAAVNRLAALSGSNDGRQWYIIDDHLLLLRSFESTADEYLQELKIPLSSYRFFKLVIDNNQNDPLNITRAGFYNQQYESVPDYYNRNSLPSITQKDNAGNSLVLAYWEKPCHIDRLRLQIKGPRFYKRTVRIHLPGVDSNKPGELVANFTLTSFSENIVDIPRTKITKLFFIVDNGDNPPVEITAIESEQLATSILTHFDMPGTYHLLVNNEAAVAPQYDLPLFKDSVPLNTPVLSFGKISGYKKPALVINPNNNWWIWPIITGIIVLLALLSYKLSTEMKKTSP